MISFKIVGTTSMDKILINLKRLSTFRSHLMKVI